MKTYRKTKHGVAICPFFTWTSENIEGCGHTETDVNLVHCTHPDNPNDREGNCVLRLCPLSFPQPKEVTKIGCSECGDLTVVPHGNWTNKPCPKCQKPESEFVEECRKLLDKCGNFSNYTYHEQSSLLFVQLSKTCDRLASAEKENKELKEADVTHFSAYSGLRQRFEKLTEENQRLKKILVMIETRLLLHGKWDENCFYYNNKSASELEEPLNLIKQALKENTNG